jgi:hypothetical protein
MQRGQNSKGYNLQLMATIQDLQKQLANVRQQLLQALPDIAIENTVVAKAIIENKIRKVGFGVMYSAKVVPAWFFLGKELNASGRNFIISKMNDGEAMNWAQLKAAEGLPAGHVDLSHTNKMWAALTPMQPQINGGKIIVGLGANNKEAADKLNWNRERYGDFLGIVLGPPEMKILGDTVLGKVRRILADNGIK